MTDKLIQKQIQEFDERFGNIVVITDEWMPAVEGTESIYAEVREWLEKALLQAKQEGYTEGTAYKGKAKREWYMRGCREERERIISKIQSHKFTKEQINMKKPEASFQIRFNSILNALAASLSQQTPEEKDNCICQCHCDYKAKHEEHLVTSCSHCTIAHSGGEVEVKF